MLLLAGKAGPPAACRRIFEPVPVGDQIPPVGAVGGDTNFTQGGDGGIKRHTPCGCRRRRYKFYARRQVGLNCTPPVGAVGGDTNFTQGGEGRD